MIRDETTADSTSVYAVNHTAFGREDEADLVDALRASGVTICSLVAEIDSEVVGHILFSKATLEDVDKRVEIAALGPMAVLPAFQRRGVGSALVRVGLAACRTAGYPLVVVVGHPWFYPRFGFQPARPLGITWDREVPDDVFMVAPLKRGAPEGTRGIVRYHAAFNEV